MKAFTSLLLIAVASCLVSCSSTKSGCCEAKKGDCCDKDKKACCK